MISLLAGLQYIQKIELFFIQNGISHKNGSSGKYLRKRGVYWFYINYFTVNPASSINVWMSWAERVSRSALS